MRLLQQAKDAFAGGLPPPEDRSLDIAQLKQRLEVVKWLSGGGQEGCGGVGQEEAWWWRTDA